MLRSTRLRSSCLLFGGKIPSCLSLVIIVVLVTCSNQFELEYVSSTIMRVVKGKGNYRKKTCVCFDGSFPSFWKLLIDRSNAFLRCCGSTETTPLDDDRI